MAVVVDWLDLCLLGLRLWLFVLFGWLLLGFNVVVLTVGCLCFAVVGCCISVISRKLDGCIVVIAGIVVLELLFGCFLVCCGLWAVGVLVALLVGFDYLVCWLVVGALIVCGDSLFVGGLLVNCWELSCLRFSYGLDLLVYVSCFIINCCWLCYLLQGDL